ncbi:MAG: glycoside hydrolase family 127 protein [Clostridia bacterium]|nr:glycoside hydrolase family 127 protein [Clostridia bacterium]
MNQWEFYTTNEIKPRGWIKKQLEIQAEGLSGNLDKVWKDIKDSAWIGGTSEGWERVPYWLDGFIPLAHLLENEDMIRRAKKYVDAIITRQESDGWICPCNKDEREEYDTWAIQLITKVLVVYYQCSKDERIPSVVYKVLKNYYELLKSKKIKLFNWGKYRWFETFIAINFTYRKYKEEWLLELAKILRSQGTDYTELLSLWEKPLNAWKYETHAVNIVMALKYEAVSTQLTGGTYADKAEELYEKLYNFNGTPVGLFTGDECLSGLSPIQGTELCSVVEQMYSYELLYAHTGDTKWAERLEMLAFNALPATISDDMWAHQYVQMSNQIACKRFPGKSLFRTNNSEAHLFGLEPNFGCCTANFNQGWPKFTLSAFMHNADTVINAIPIPAELTCDKAHIKLETNYPFENRFRYSINAKKDFLFKVRIPHFAKNLMVDNQEITENELSFKINADESKEIEISFETTPYLEKRPYDLYTVKYGSLVFSLPVKYEKKMYEYERDGVERKFPYCDYEYIPASEWNYAYCNGKFSVDIDEISDVPFSSEKPPIKIKAKMKNIHWEFEDGYNTVCAKVPTSRISKNPEKEILLYPYGCCKLRMTELPLIDCYPAQL